ncbi:zinc finger protein hangover-like [Impatiens glandulifera]|uniref:zinc finger protein hangover-like n=1 Tax=Impatiens glandulifera TaxID=253017 RepID=UPI001FB0A032|nr:zinc finger protein hangover-like [Impatiens glandulifera]
MEEDWFEETVIFSIVKDIVHDDVDDDDGSSSWEIIGQSSSDDDEFDCYSLDDDDDLSLASHFSIGSSSGKKPIIDAPLDTSCVDIPCILVKDLSFGYVEEVIDEEDDVEEEGDEDGSMDESDEYDLDDELVPMCVSDRFEKQRIRKIGKRAYPRMNKSKKMPHYYNRPGCVYGKHGLGLKHSI